MKSETTVTELNLCVSCFDAIFSGLVAKDIPLKLFKGLAHSGMPVITVRSANTISSQAGWDVLKKYSQAPYAETAILHPLGRGGWSVDEVSKFDQSLVHRLPMEWNILEVGGNLLDYTSDDPPVTHHYWHPIPRGS